MRSFLLIATLWVFLLPCRGQFMREAPPELAKLQFLIGDWEATGEIVINGETHQHTSYHRFAWAVKKRWLQEEMQAVFPNGGPMDGLRWLTYNRAKQCFSSFWVDVQIDRPIEKTGHLMGPQELVLLGSMPWEGETIHFKSVYRGVAEDRLEVTHFIGNDLQQLRINSKKTWRRKSG